MTVDGFDGWTMSSQKYVKAAINNVEEVLARTDQRLPSKCGTPLKSGYQPERDTSPELMQDGLQRYQELIGMLRWAVEHGRVDILLETALMSTPLALPRWGHLEQLYHIFGYFKAHPKSNLFFDLQHPKVDEQLMQDGLLRNQELIGMLRWAVEQGRVDILLETSLMSTHLALPQWGHLEQLYHIFGYLKAHPKRNLFFDPQHPKVDERSFKTYDWYNFYRDAKERFPSDMPTPRGRLVSTHCFVDFDHAWDKVTSRSQTGILIFLNRPPTFGSEFITMKTAVEQIESLQYKLRMFGVSLEGPTSAFCDNKAVFKNASQPDSTLKKKHTSICYHRCREAVACRTIRIAKEGTITNLNDLFTKPLTRLTRENLLDCFAY